MGDLGWLLDSHLNQLPRDGVTIPVRCVMNDQVVGDLGRMRIIGLNIVQGDSELGTYIELELEEE